MKKTKSTFKINKKSEKIAQTFKQSWEVHFFQGKRRLRTLRGRTKLANIFPCIFLGFHAFSCIFMLLFHFIFHLLLEKHENI